jgi:hypothetical protein
MLHIVTVSKLLDDKSSDVMSKGCGRLDLLFFV